ncbi:MAG: hypothetical protein MI863_24435 [Desulfobacterales bacterium]|nr:hypothetical protein [Desulfobacterales bacterium]
MNFYRLLPVFVLFLIGCSSIQTTIRRNKIIDETLEESIPTVASVCLYHEMNASWPVSSEDAYQFISKVNDRLDDAETIKILSKSNAILKNNQTTRFHPHNNTGLAISYEYYNEKRVKIILFYTGTGQSENIKRYSCDITVGVPSKGGEINYIKPILSEEQIEFLSELIMTSLDALTREIGKRK